MFKTLIGLNVALVLSVIAAALGGLWGALNGWLGTWVGLQVAERFISPSPGIPLAAIEGMVFGFLGGIVVLAGLFAVLLVISFIFGGGSGGIPILDAGGGLLGWLGEGPTDFSGVGLIAIAIPSLLVAPIVAAIAAAQTNGASIIHPLSALYDIVILIVSGLFALAGLILGIVGGFIGGKESPETAALAGMIDGALIGGFLIGGWVPAITLGVVGGIFLYVLWKIKSNILGCLVFIVGIAVLRYLLLGTWEIAIS